MKKKVYIGLSGDFIHHGHINLITKASKLGALTVGLLTDKAILTKRDLPYLNYEQRKSILSSFKQIKNIIPQNDWDYSVNIKKIKPDFFVHGDDWKKNSDNFLRKKVISALNSYGGKLIEVSHTKGVSSIAYSKNVSKKLNSPIYRSSKLQRLLLLKKELRFIEVHSPISGMIVEQLVVAKKKQRLIFDGFWSSSLTDSINLGKPDNESLDIHQRLQNVNNIFDVTTKPLIMDFDSGGRIEHLIPQLKSAERLGVSAVILEDKKGLKKNSLLEKGNDQKQDSIKSFSKKINVSRKNIYNKDFKIFARIESLILGKDIKDAILRAKSYIKAGADGIMIHSKSKESKEVLDFAKKFKSIKNFENTILICVPTTYNSILDKKLFKAGFNIIIYANHLMRASLKSMKDISQSILDKGRSFEIEKKLLPIDEIVNFKL